MLYEFHKKVDYIIKIHLSSKNTIEVFFPENIFKENLPRYLRYEMTTEGLLYTQDNSNGFLYRIDPALYRLCVMVDVTVKCTDYEISDDLCIGFDVDNDELPYNNASEIIMTLMPAIDEEKESNVYHYLFNGIGDVTGLEEEVEFIQQLVQTGGLSNIDNGEAYE